MGKGAKKLGNRIKKQEVFVYSLELFNGKGFSLHFYAR